jgi:hypothetical protein
MNKTIDGAAADCPIGHKANMPAFGGKADITI